MWFLASLVQRYLYTVAKSPFVGLVSCVPISEALFPRLVVVDFIYLVALVVFKLAYWRAERRKQQCRSKFDWKLHSPSWHCPLWYNNWFCREFCGLSKVSSGWSIHKFADPTTLWSAISKKMALKKPRRASKTSKVFFCLHRCKCTFEQVRAAPVLFL